MTTTVQVLSVRSPAMPRGSRVASNLFLRALAWLGSKPTPRARTRTEEATEVRELAYRVRNTDPGFSADLFAAAARHESKGD